MRNTAHVSKGVITLVLRPENEKWCRTETSAKVKENSNLNVLKIIPNNRPIHTVCKLWCVLALSKLTELIMWSNQGCSYTEQWCAREPPRAPHHQPAILAQEPHHSRVKNLHLLNVKFVIPKLKFCDSKRQALLIFNKCQPALETCKL